MRESFVIKYEFQSNEGFDLALIGSSFVGFDRVIKELLQYANLSDKVEVRTTRVKQGSVEVLNTILCLDPLFIQDPAQLIEFLKIAQPSLISGINSFLAIKGTLNEYYSKNPLDFEVTLLVSAYLINSMRLASKAKQGDKAMIESSDATPRQIKRLKNMVRRGHYKKALTPITQGNISRVEFSTLDKDKKFSVVISDENVGDFLPDDEQVLPELEHGDRIPMTGELQLLGSTHGDSMKIRIRDIDPENSLLDATLVEGLDIIDYKDLFKQAVYLDAEIVRKNMYKRPTLVIHEMTALQEKLNLVLGSPKE